MTNDEIILELQSACAKERSITSRVVELIAECLKRGLWCERGHSSPHRWLMMEFKYSEAAAARRLNAARLLDIAPEISEKIETGELTLTTLSKLQTAFYHEEKRRRAEVSNEVKQEILKKVENTSTADAEKILAEEFPEIHQAPKESLKILRDEAFALTISFNQSQMAQLQRARELLSHSHAGSGWAEILSYLALEFNQRKDPILREQRRKARSEKPSRNRIDVGGCERSDLTEPERADMFERENTEFGAQPLQASHLQNKPADSAAESRPPLPRTLRDQIIARAGGVCEYEDPKTKTGCGSRTRLEVDHRIPRALGGDDSFENLRCLCANHNRFVAEQELGKSWTNAWRRAK